jgi:hypothetical protein
MAESKNIVRGNNPLEIIQNPIIVATGLGVVAGNLARKALYTGNREAFGWAAKSPNGDVDFYAIDPETGKPDLTKPLPNAYTNRIFLNIGFVLGGTLAIGASEDPNIELFGVGVAASGMANVVMSILKLDN